MSGLLAFQQAINKILHLKKNITMPTNNKLTKVTSEELEELIEKCESAIHSYYYVIQELDNTEITLTKMDYLNFIDFLEYQTDDWNIVSSHQEYDPVFIHYNVVHEDNKIKIAIDETTDNNHETISEFVINLVNNY